MSTQLVLGEDGSSFPAWKSLFYANGGRSVTRFSAAVCLGF
jgi:hypothetical protein